MTPFKSCAMCNYKRNWMYNPNVSQKNPPIVANGLKRAFIIHGQTEFMIGKYQQTGYDWKILNASKITHLLKGTLLNFLYCQVLLNPFVWHAYTSRCRKHHVLTFFMSDIVPYSYLSFVVCVVLIANSTAFSCSLSTICMEHHTIIHQL